MNRQELWEQAATIIAADRDRSSIAAHIIAQLNPLVAAVDEEAVRALRVVAEMIDEMISGTAH